MNRISETLVNMICWMLFKVLRWSAEAVAWTINTGEPDEETILTRRLRHGLLIIRTTEEAEALFDDVSESMAANMN